MKSIGLGGWCITKTRAVPFDIGKGYVVQIAGRARRQILPPLVGDYFKAQEEEIKKEMGESQDPVLTRTEESQCQPSQPLRSEPQGSQPSTAIAPIQQNLSKSTYMKLKHLRSRVNTLPSVHEEREKGLVIAVPDLIAHWLQVKLVHDVWDGLPFHEQTFGRMLRVCLQCDLTAKLEGIFARRRNN